MVSTTNQEIKVSGNEYYFLPWHQDMQDGRHLLRRVSMTSAVYFTHAEKTVIWSVCSNHFFKSKAQHKELLKIITLCLDTKDNANRIISVWNLCSLPVPLLFRHQRRAKMLNYWFPFKSISFWILVSQLILKIEKVWIKDHSAEVLGLESSIWITIISEGTDYTFLKMKGAYRDQLVQSSYFIDEETATWQFDRFVQSCAVQYKPQVTYLNLIKIK